MAMAAVWQSFQDTLFVLALRHGILSTLELFEHQQQEQLQVPESLQTAARQDQATGQPRPVHPIDHKSVSDDEITKEGIISYSCNLTALYSDALDDGGDANQQPN